MNSKIAVVILFHGEGGDGYRVDSGVPMLMIVGEAVDENVEGTAVTGKWQQQLEMR